MSFTEAEEQILKAVAQGILNATAPRTANAPRSAGAAPMSLGDELTDSFLDSQPWADMAIKKDPPRWGGPTQVGNKYSDAPSEWHKEMAGFLDWKAAKGRDESPVRLQTSGKGAGKPWHEADTFGAKICRAWQRRIASQPARPVAHDSAELPPYIAPANEDDLPF